MTKWYIASKLEAVTYLTPQERKQLQDLHQKIEQGKVIAGDNSTHSITVQRIKVK